MGDLEEHASHDAKNPVVHEWVIDYEGKDRTRVWTWVKVRAGEWRNEVTFPLQDRREGTTIVTFHLFERKEDDRLGLQIYWLKF